MKWFNNWFQRKCQEAWENSKQEREEEIYKNSVPSIRGLKIGTAKGYPLTKASVQLPNQIELNSQPMRFNVYPANGGHIVEYFYVNEKTDKHDQALHLIPSDKDLGTEIAKIMTLEVLKR